MEVDPHNNLQPGQQIVKSKNQTIAFKRLQFAVTVLGVALVVVGVVAHMQTNDQRSVQEFNKKQLVPTLEYFDRNRDASPIMKLDYVETGTECNSLADTPTDILDLWNFPGTVNGCYGQSQNSVSRGNCQAGIGESVHSVGPINNLHQWRSGHFCAKYLDQQNAQLYTEVQKEEACGTTMFKCNQCECFQGAGGDVTDCPVTNFTIIEDAGGVPDGSTGKSYKYNEITQEENKGFLIGINATFYGLPCKNPTAFSKHGGVHYQLLDRSYEGCGKLDEDSNYAVRADHVEIHPFAVSNFYSLTSEVTDLPLFIKTIDDDRLGVFLSGRFQIVTACEQTCRDFRFNPKATYLLHQYSHIWDNIKHASHTALFFGFGAILAALVILIQKSRATKSTERLVMGWILFLLVVYVVLTQSLQALIIAACVAVFVVFVFQFKPKQWTQNQLLFSYCWCVIGSLAFLLMLWRVKNVITREYNVNRTHFLHVERNRCIQDEGWNNVLKTFNRHTDLTDTEDYIMYIGWVAIVCVVGQLVLLYYTVGRLNQRFGSGRRSGGYGRGYQ